MHPTPCVVVSLWVGGGPNPDNCGQSRGCPPPGRWGEVLLEAVAHDDGAAVRPRRSPGGKGGGGLLNSGNGRTVPAVAGHRKGWGRGPPPLSGVRGTAESLSVLGGESMAGSLWTMCHAAGGGGSGRAPPTRALSLRYVFLRVVTWCTDTGPRDGARGGLEMSLRVATRPPPQLARIRWVRWRFKNAPAMCVLGWACVGRDSLGTEVLRGV